MTIFFLLFLQIKRFQEKNEATLTTAQRELKQAVENGEANIAWMNKNYDKIGSWFQEQRKKKVKVYRKQK